MDNHIPKTSLPAALPVRSPDALPRRSATPVQPRAQPSRDDAGSARLRPDTDRGARALMNAALGRAVLPPPLELMAALDSAQRHAPLADRAVPGLGKLVSAIIEDERLKLGRMLDLGRQ